MAKTQRFRKGGWKFFPTTDNPNLHFFQMYAPGPVLAKPPEQLQEFLASDKPVGITHYQARKEGFVTTYLLRAPAVRLMNRAKSSGKSARIIPITTHASSSNQKELFPNVDFRGKDQKRKRKPIPFDVEITEEIDYQYNVRYTLRKDLGELTTDFFRALRLDIVSHNKGIPAKEVLDLDHYDFVDNIIINPLIKWITPHPKQLVMEGKGRFYDLCQIDLGSDITTGCFVDITTDGTYDQNNICSYCYAHQNRLPATTTMYQFTEEEYQEIFQMRTKDLGLSDTKKIVVRLGQRSEVIAPESIRAITGYEDKAVTLLRALAHLREKRPLASVLVSKLLDYKSAYVPLFKEANTSIGVSILDSRLEKGVLEHGFSVERRLDAARQYQEKGLPVFVFLAVDVTRPMKFWNNDAKKAYKFAKQNKLGLQNLDTRITRKKDAMVLGGEPWHRLVAAKGDPDQTNMFAPAARFHRSNQGYLIANNIHPSYKKFMQVTGNYRACFTHTPNSLSCGTCFTNKPKNNLVQILGE